MYRPGGGGSNLCAAWTNPTPHFVTVSVKDTGAGIPAEMRERIFEMFAQIDRAMERGHTGLGIGLTLVKSLVEMHRGAVEVHSAGPGQGSEFRVRLPILTEPEIERPRPAAPEEQTQTTKRRVLVVDDNQAAADLLGRVVKMLGNEVRAAYDGQQAIEAAEQFRPDVVLMDLGMPKLNGYEAARRIRAQAWGRDMVLVALTGWGQDENKRRAKEAGFDHHLVKPADPAELQRLLAEPH
jgi:CheY-like chemotaxis protein